MQAVTTQATREYKQVARAEYNTRFTKAYETYYTRVFAFIYSRVRDPELAKDLAAGVFEKAYVKGHEVRDPAAYGAWLFMIAKNLIAGHFRKSTREFRNIERAGEELRFVDSSPDPEDFVIRDERAGQLMNHLRTLPKRDQELLSLKFDAELTNAEIASIVGMTALNVRVAIFRALRRLKAKMEAADARAEAAA